MISACTVAASLDHRTQYMDGPPALDLKRKRTEKRKREKFYIYLDVTHTHTHTGASWGRDYPWWTMSEVSKGPCNVHGATDLRTICTVNSVPLALESLHTLTPLMAFDGSWPSPELALTPISQFLRSLDDDKRYKLGDPRDLLEVVEPTVVASSQTFPPDVIGGHGVQNCLMR